MGEENTNEQIDDCYYYDLIERGQLVQSWWFSGRGVDPSLWDWKEWHFYFGKTFGKYCLNVNTPFFSFGYGWGGV